MSGFIALHVGVGNHSIKNYPAYKATMKAACRVGQQVLRDGGGATEAVTAAIAVLEECQLTNAGRGSSLTSAGSVECDACVMDGCSLRYGAVGAVTGVCSPIALAAKILQHQDNHITGDLVPPALLVGEGARLWGKQRDVRTCRPSDLITDQSWAMHRKCKRHIKKLKRDERQLELEDERDNSEEESAVVSLEQRDGQQQYRLDTSSDHRKLDCRDDHHHGTHSSNNYHRTDCGDDHHRTDCGDDHGTDCKDNHHGTDSKNNYHRTDCGDDHHRTDCRCDQQRPSDVNGQHLPRIPRRQKKAKELDKIGCHSIEHDCDNDDNHNLQNSDNITKYCECSGSSDCDEQCCNQSSFRRLCADGITQENPSITIKSKENIMSANPTLRSYSNPRATHARQEGCKRANGPDNEESICQSKIHKPDQSAEAILQSRLDTVGCVAVGAGGDVAAGVSSGGLVHKTPGRVGQSAVFGAGCWAENDCQGSGSNIAACSTGCGEMLVLTNLAASSARCIAQHSHAGIEHLPRHLRTIFLDSKFLSSYKRPKSGGCLVVRHDPTDGSTDLYCFHSASKMGFAYMGAENTKPTAMFSALPPEKEGKDLVLDFFSYYPSRRALPPQPVQVEEQMAVAEPQTYDTELEDDQVLKETFVLDENTQNGIG